MKAHQRAKVAAIAKTADYNPSEADVAQRMLDATPEGQLDLISADIKAEWGKGIDSQFAIGHLLIKARQQFAADIEYGRWLRSQFFPFSYETANRMRNAALREPEVREFIAGLSRSTDRREISVTTAITYMNDGRVEGGRKKDVVGEPAQVDPNYAVIRAAYNKVLNPTPEGEAQGNGFIGMHIDDLLRARDMLKALVESWTAAKQVFEDGQRGR